MQSGLIAGSQVIPQIGVQQGQFGSMLPQGVISNLQVGGVLPQGVTSDLQVRGMLPQGESSAHNITLDEPHKEKR